MILVTDPRWSLTRIEAVIEAAGNAASTGTFIVQLRDKTASAADLARVAKRLREVTSRSGARLVVNAAVPEALAIAVDVGADGAHVPCVPERIATARARFGPTAFLSTPAHSDDDVEIADAAGATAVLVSPIFTSPGKGPPRGLQAIASARKWSERLQLFALGGVDAANAGSCARAGADGVAVIRALLDAADVVTVVHALDAPFRAHSRA